jgi:hypothetical protein
MAETQIIPPRIVVEQKTFERVAELTRRPRKPTKALRELMGGKKTRLGAIPKP